MRSGNKAILNDCSQNLVLLFIENFINMETLLQL